MEDFIQKTERQSTYCMHAQLLQSGHTLCDPMDCSPPGSSVHGILQARILEWFAMLSRGSSQPRDVSCTAGEFFTDAPPGKPWLTLREIIPDYLSKPSATIRIL